MSKDIGETSDGYHTFTELYEHRHALFCALVSTNSKLAWKSRLHDDGTMFDGDWFVAGMSLPDGQISYHLPGSYWDKVHAVELDRAPKWDGHTPQDVVWRLLNFADPII